MTNPPRDKLYTRWGQLKTERATWVAHWKEISTYLLPRSGRYFVQDRDRGEAAPAAAQTAKNASQINPQQLQDVIGLFSGYTTPQGGV